MCWYAVWIEGNVTEILENERINTAAGQGARVIDDPINDGVETERSPRGTGQCRYMQRAGYGFAVGAEHIP
jgi:hypothetical protein